MTQQPFSFNFENLKDGDNCTIKNPKLLVTGEDQSLQQEQQESQSTLNSDDLIGRKIKNREKLELNELPKSILVEILKHLNDNYSCCITTKPQNPFFHNYCYSDQMTNGKDSSGNSKSKDKAIKGKSNKNSGTLNNNQSCDQQLPQFNKITDTPTPTSISTLKEHQKSQIVEPNTCIYIKDILNLALVCKMWAKYIVPISISSFIKISSKREFEVVKGIISNGIVKGGLPFSISTIKFHNPQKQPANCEPCSPVPLQCQLNPTTPEDFKQLFSCSYQTLRSICFGTGVLTVPIFQVICDFLKDSNSCNIQELKINTNLCGQGYKLLNETLLHNSTITYLDISNNSMSRESITDLVVVLNSNRTISYLDLSFNNIGYNGVILADFLKVNTTIQSLFLIGNQLDNDSVQAISEVLKHKNQSITEISFSENDFDDEIGSLIGEIFLSNRTIKSIDLSFNNLSEGTVQGFSDALLSSGSGQYCALETLNLSDCNMSESEEYGIQFFRALQTNQTLKTLILWSCELRSTRILDELATALKLNQTLTEVSLGFNNFTSDDISVLVQKGLKFNKSLRVISFNNNYISTVGGIIIAEYLKSNDTIKEISLFDNCLDNCAAVEFMNTLCVNHNIRKLCLGSNRVCPNLSNIFRKLLQYNRSIPRISSYNNSRQQWITTKLQFLRSELLNLNMKFDQQTQLSNSIRELFKVLNVSCPPSQAQNNQVALNSLHYAFMNSMTFTNKVNSNSGINNNNSSPVNNNKQTVASPITTTTNNNCSINLNNPNYLWQPQSNIQQQILPQQSPQQKSINISQPAQQLFGIPLQKPIFNPQPLFQYPTSNTPPNAFQQQHLQQQQPNNIFLPNHSQQPQQLQQQPQQLQQQPNTIPNIYSTQQRITRQFEDELIQLQSQLQCDLNNNPYNQQTNPSFNTFF